MSIKIKLLLGCFLLTLGTLTLGFFAESAQRQIGGLAVQIYDDALISTNALRSAQNELLGFDSSMQSQLADSADGLARPLGIEQARSLASQTDAILSDLSIASGGAMSRQGYEAVASVRARLAKISVTGGKISVRLFSSELSAAHDDLEAAVRIFAGDAYNVRRDVGNLIETSINRTRLAMGIAALFALLVSVLLSRTITPALRHALTIAKSIAGGNLENKIVTGGSRETAELMKALSTMQDSLSRHFGLFETRVASQTNDYNGRMSVQNARFDAALTNMKHGLCMFDAAASLVVYNRRFAEIFGEKPIGSHFADLRRDGVLAQMLDLSASDLATHRTADGRLIEVSRQAVDGGGQVFTFDDVTDPHNASIRLSHLANHDPLTNLPNRTRLLARLREILGSGASLGDIAFLTLDLDGFKYVNDTLGHSVGDRLLNAAAERMRLSIGKGDFVARIGGDEFAVIQVAQPQPKSSEELARRLIADLSAPFEIENNPITIGASLGLVIAGSRAGESAAPDAEILMKRADLALHSARAGGRNSYRFFEAGMDDDMQRRRWIEIDLGTALESGDLELHYQPFVNVARDEVTGFEALLRWHHPVHGMVSPGEFIPIAEQSALIVPIGLWVLETACREAATWPGALTISVNLSPLQFRSSTLLADVARIVAKSGLPHSRLQLEVTENVLLHDTDSVLEVLNGFRRLGIRISMDDFGTGYSSLGYLSRFPFDKVKIDQSFVRDLGKRENIAVVRAVVGLSKAMGISVIAEGVETRAQVDALLHEACEEMQGYFFSRARPAANLPEFMRDFSRSRRQTRMRLSVPTFSAPASQGALSV